MMYVVRRTVKKVYEYSVKANNPDEAQKEAGTRDDLPLETRTEVFVYLANQS